MILATWFGSGKLRPGPGTWGTLAALPFAFAIHAATGWIGLFLATGIVTAIGVWAAHTHSQSLGVHDASEIVIDEVAGIWLCLLFVELSLASMVLGFILFRVFDIAKPWPIRWLDRRVKGGVGVMLDDLVAGIAAGVLLWASIAFIIPSEWLSWT